MRKMKTIWVLQGVASGWGAAVLRGLARYAEHRDPWEFRVAAWGEAPLGVPPQDAHVDGLIAAVSDEGQEQALVDRGLPCVNVAGTVEVRCLPSVLIDDEPVGRMAGEYLLQRGLRQFAYCGSEGWHFSAGRREGFREAVGAAGCECHVLEPLRRRGLGTTEQELAKLEGWVAALPRPIGLMACNDIRARDVAGRMPRPTARALQATTSAPATWRGRACERA